MNQKMNSTQFLFFPEIESWLLKKKNYLQYGLNLSILDESTFLSNDFLAEHLEVADFYSIKTQQNGHTEFEDNLKGKEVFFSKWYKMKKMFTYDNFSKNFDDKKNSRNPSLVMSIQQLWSSKYSMPEFVNSHKGLNDILSISAENFLLNQNEILNWKNLTFRQNNYSKCALFVPATTNSVFSKKNYYYEIKYYKYLMRNVVNKMKMSGFSETENIENFKMHLDHDGSIRCDNNIAYFDPIKYIVFEKQESNSFYKLIIEPLSLSKEMKYSFIHLILDIINIQYFEVVKAQQDYVVNRIILTPSKSRSRMNLKDVLENMIQRFNEKRTNAMYFLDFRIERENVEYLIEIIKNDPSADFRILYVVLQWDKYNMTEEKYSQIDQLIFQLELIFQRKTLRSFVQDTIQMIQILFEDAHIPFSRKMKSYLLAFLSNLFEVDQQKKNKTISEGSQEKHALDRKYLNEFYMKDLRMLKNGDKIFTTLLLEHIDFLSIQKMMGYLDDNIESSIFKRR